MEVDSPVVVNRGGSGSGFAKRGTKRGASDSNLSDFERFEKRLRLLTLRNERNGESKSHLYTPVTNDATETTTNGYTHTSQEVHAQHELMHIDNTPNRVFIHDLDAELADTDTDEERLVFLPDIEKHFSKLPHQVLASGHPGNQDLVLYSVPKSLTVDEDHDSVRKAIIEARHRQREQAVEEARQMDMERMYDFRDCIGERETAHGYSNGYDNPHGMDNATEMDYDAMDIG